ncbi:BamA/TamA family outer membrane protein [uncultured Hymenobacter sp.]|uniref:BamA/TamA family outer membrane protein n=1 Tax=uncultured Hymenobacter sp. TaxID=170016 RepID=UPI0035C9E3C5
MRLPFLIAAACGLSLPTLAQIARPPKPAIPVSAPTSPTILAVAPPAAPGSGLRGLAADEPNKKNLTILPIPVIFYQDETGLGYGLGGLVSGRLGADTATRPSNARVQYWQTEKKQSLIQLVHTVFTPGEAFYLNGEISLYDTRLFYYGKGNDTPDDNESLLGYKLFIINQRVQKQVAPKVFAGLLYRFTNVYDFDFNRQAENGTTNSFLTDPRVSIRERQAHRTSGLGPALTLDTRDNASTTFRGNYVDGTVLFAGGGLGSDFKFTRYQLDARHFQPLGSAGRSVLAVQYVGQFHTGKVPFREQAGIGANIGGTLYNNANLLRGIYEQRYRDRQMMMVQAELRQKLFWRLDGAVFGGVGQVAEALDGFAFDGVKAAGGGGIRFNFIRRDRINLRLDYAVGTGGSSGIYFAIGEAF